MTERNPAQGPEDDPGRDHGNAGENQEAAPGHGTGPSPAERTRDDGRAEAEGPTTAESTGDGPPEEQPGAAQAEKESGAAPAEKEPGVAPAEGPGGSADRCDPSLPDDEEAAWAAIVAGYGREPDDPVRPTIPAEPDRPGEEAPRTFAVHVPAAGPRDHVPPEEGEDEGHFVPPEPPPLPEADATTKFAWTAAVGGPLLILAFMLTGSTMSWWVYTLGVGGFLGGFATLVARMRDEDDDEDDPGRGAVV